MKKYNFDIKTTKVQTPTGVQYHVDKIDTGLLFEEYSKDVHPVEMFVDSRFVVESVDHKKLTVYALVAPGPFLGVLKNGQVDDKYLKLVCEIDDQIEVGRVYPLSKISDVLDSAKYTVHRIEMSKKARI